MNESVEPQGLRILTEPAVQWARSHPAYFLREDEPIREQIEQQLILGAQAVGASDVELIRCEAWSVLGSTHDWFRGRRFPLDDDTAFEQARAFPELGANAVPGEFVAGAFANGVLVADVNGVRLIRNGIAPTDAVLEVFRRHPHWTRAVAIALTKS